MAVCCDIEGANCTLAPEGMERAWVKVGIACVLAGQGMAFGLGYNIAEPRPEFGSAGYLIVHGGLLISAILVMAILGPNLIRAAWPSMKRFQISVELLFILGITGAFVGSLVTTLSGEGSVYYEVVAILLAIYTIGRLLGERSRARALKETERMREQFASAWRYNAKGGRERVPLSVLSKDKDTVSVIAGDPFTVDGKIIKGRGYVQESTMTGESLPRVVKAGDTVLAGSYSVDGDFDVQPTALGGERQLDAVLKTVEQARGTPSILQQQAEQLIGWFVPVVILISAGTFVGWLTLSSAPWWEALFNSMAVLLVACPCALGLATPVAVWSGLYRLSEFGLVGKRADFIDRLALADVMLFDKTGTLSEDQLTMVDFVVAEDSPLAESALLKMVRAVESRYNHPVAKAFHGECDNSIQIMDTKTVPGQGVNAKVGYREKSYTISIGESDLSSVSVNTLQKASTYSGKRVYVFLDDQPVALAVLSEKLRTRTEEALNKLKKLGIKTAILTGDKNPPFKELGSATVYAALSPEDKLRIAQELAGGSDSWVFVGDGINDAGTMAHCPAAVAMGQGTSLAQANAAAVLMGGSLEALPQAVELCRKIRKSIFSNIRFAALYNAVGMSFAASGYLHPVLAVLLMLASSTFVTSRVIRASHS